MNDDDRRLHELLSDAVSGVEPNDRLGQLRERTRGDTMSERRPWWYAVGGAAVATAAVIAAFAILGSGDGEPGPATSPSPTASDTEPGPSDPASEPADDGTVVPVYYAGDTPQGLRLYREFQRVDGDPLLGAASAATAGTPLDPDYRSLWGGEFVADVSFDGAGDDGKITVTLADQAATEPLPGMSADDAELAVQQLVYTLQGVTQTRAPVHFYLGSEPAETVLGLAASEPFKNAPQLDVLALVNVTVPEEGAAVSGGTLEASGVASSFEANVPWQILDSGGREVLTGFATAEGFMDRLYPWSTSINVSSLEPGTYTFRAQTDDPSGGEGGGPTEDTKTITIG